MNRNKPIEPMVSVVMRIFCFCTLVILVAWLSKKLWAIPFQLIFPELSKQFTLLGSYNMPYVVLQFYFLVGAYKALLLFDRSDQDLMGGLNYVKATVMVPILPWINCNINEPPKYINASLPFFRTVVFVFGLIFIFMVLVVGVLLFNNGYIIF